MRRGPLVLASLLVAGFLWAEASRAPGYQRHASPFMGEFPFTLAQPVDVRVEIDGVRIDAITITPSEEVQPAATARCGVRIAGQNAGTRRAKVSIVLLLEERSGRSLERLVLDGIRPRPGRAFDETQRRDIAGASLQAARKVYVYVEVS